MKTIPLTQGKFAIVDDDVFEWAQHFKWYALKARCTFYAVRNIPLSGGKRARQRMHREILNAPLGVLVDHKDCNGLNNRLDNLRKCSAGENCRNSRKRCNNTSGFIGVHFYRPLGKWVAHINVEGLQKHLGYFDTAVAAALARDNAAIKFHGAFARLNSPESPQ